MAKCMKLMGIWDDDMSHKRYFWKLTLTLFYSLKRRFFLQNVVLLQVGYIDRKIKKNGWTKWVWLFHKMEARLRGHLLMAAVLWNKLPPSGKSDTWKVECGAFLTKDMNAVFVTSGFAKICNCCDCFEGAFYSWWASAFIPVFSQT